MSDAGLARRATARRSLTLVVGHGSVHLASGAHTALKMTLTRKGFALLRAHRKLTATVKITISGAGRKTITRTLHLKLIYRKPKKR